MMIGLQAQAGLLFVEAGSEFTFSGGPKLLVLLLSLIAPPISSSWGLLYLFS